MTKRPEKKSETIEVRVSYTEKLAFMEACRQAGTTASHAIRDYIGDFLKPAGSQKAHSPLAFTVGFALIVGLIAAIAYFSLNQPSSITIGERVVRYFDHDDDNAITALDAVNIENKDTINWLLATGDQNNDGQLIASEINALTDVTIELRGEHPDRLAPSTGEKIIIIPPGLTSSERQAFMEQYTGTTVSARDQDRLQRLIDALSASKTETKDIHQN